MSGLIVLNKQKDILHYEDVLHKYVTGQMKADQFSGERLLMGVYAQRQEEMFMLRTKLPGGYLRPIQLRGIAEAVEKFSTRDSAHITTRQDIQFYDLKLDETPKLLRHLANYGLTTREAAGNTVRNITSCTLAGVCPHEHVDISVHVQQTARYFLHHPLTQMLPRKFKISFSGCETDCSQGLIHDMAFIATNNNGQAGFKVMVGGGLGVKPHEAQLLEPFIEEQMLLPVIEAVLTLHNKHSDRKRRARSRIKFLLARLGMEAFRNEYRDELSRTVSAFDEKKTPRGQWRQATTKPDANHAITLHAPAQQQQPGYYAVPIHAPLGQLTTKQLYGLAKLFESMNLQELHTTQNQGLVVYHVAENKIDSLKQSLHELELDLPHKGNDVVSCPGTDTCPLGITASQRIASELDSGQADLSIRINGCQNSCANANTADIGLYGKGRRHFGNLVPSYALLLGGNGAFNGKLAIPGPDIPAVRLPKAIHRIQEAYLSQRTEEEHFTEWSHREGTPYFKTLLHDLTQVSEIELPLLTREHGDAQVFKVKNVGISECAGVQFDPVSRLLQDITYESGLVKAFAAKQKFTEAGECLDNTLYLMSKATLLQSGQTCGDADTAALVNLLRNAQPNAMPLWDTLESLVTALTDFRNNPDELIYPELKTQIEGWLIQARENTKGQQAMTRPAVTAPLVNA